MMNKIKQESELITLDKSNMNSLLNDRNYVIDASILADDLVINIPDNYSIKIYLYNFKGNFLNVTFNQGKDSKLEFIFSIINDGDGLFNINNNITGSYNYTLVRGRVFSLENAKTIINVTGSVDKETYDNDYTEDVKALNLYSSNTNIKPNLLVSSSEVKANHMVSIGNLDIDKISYLKQKGISLEKAKEILLNAFLLNIFPSDVINDNN